MGKKAYRFRNLRKLKDFNKKQFTLHKMCVTIGFFLIQILILRMLCNNVDVHRCLYFELWLPVICCEAWSKELFQEHYIIFSSVHWLIFVDSSQFFLSSSGFFVGEFEHKLRRHKQTFGKIAITVVLDKGENLL